MIKLIHSLDELSAPEFRELDTKNNPFLDYDYLSSLEKYCNLEVQGWSPLHITCYQDNKLSGVMPMYVKINSYGEFVFDWSWAEAYEQTGRQYYPKLVSAIPFSPVTGNRCLVSKNTENKNTIINELIHAAINVCNEYQYSSLHCLFHEDELNKICGGLLLQRVGCQYHWENKGYRNFDEYLQNLNSKRRKQIKKERNNIKKTGIEIEILHGDEINHDIWCIFYKFYVSTFMRKWGNPRLSLDFFHALSVNMPASTLLVMAKLHGQYIAGAYAMMNNETLYGRHWGCMQAVPYLHFELCYYQLIEYCIKYGLKYLDAGAQGEYKVHRGFSPVKTYSSHWIRDEWFRDSIRDFLSRETIYIDQYIDNVKAHMPFRKESRIHLS